MLHEVIATLTRTQRQILLERKITPQLLSRWRHGHSLPTEIQVADLADASGAPWEELQREVTVLRAPEDRREQIARALNWRKRSDSNRQE